MLHLKDNSVSTSQQDPAWQPRGLKTPGPQGAIIDPVRGAPAESRLSVSVVARTATMSDALSTTLLVLSVEKGRALLERFPSVSAVWLLATGEVHATYRQPEFELSTGR